MNEIASSPTSTPPAAQPVPLATRHAFIVSVKNWPEARHLIFSASKESAIWRSHRAAEDIGYKVNREDFVADRADLYDQFSADFPKDNGYDMAYVEARIIGLLESSERSRAALVAALRAAHKVISAVVAWQLQDESLPPERIESSLAEAVHACACSLPDIAQALALADAAGKEGR